MGESSNRKCCSYHKLLRVLIFSPLSNYSDRALAPKHSLKALSMGQPSNWVIRHLHVVPNFIFQMNASPCVLLSPFPLSCCHITPYKPWECNFLYSVVSLIMKRAKVLNVIKSYKTLETHLQIFGEKPHMRWANTYNCLHLRQWCH